MKLKFSDQFTMMAVALPLTDEVVGEKFQIFHALRALDFLFVRSQPF